MTEYKLIALDMDGTLLNSDKEITKKSLEYIDKAFDAGKEVILSTGRCVAELEDYLKKMPRLKYVNCVSGALVYNVQTDEKIYSNPLSIETVYKLFDVAKDMDVMVHILSNDSIVQSDKLENMAKYNMDIFTSMFKKVTTPCKDIEVFYRNNPFPVEKFNFYTKSIEDRNILEERLNDLDIVMAHSEYSNLEISAKGVTKGTGLKALCDYLEMDITDTIAVGDADNDMDILKTAGLSIAMGNAKDSVKEICDVVVSDCDSEGIAEAIEKYLLKK